MNNFSLLAHPSSCCLPRYLLNDHDVLIFALLRHRSSCSLCDRQPDYQHLVSIAIISRTFSRVSSPSRFALHFDDVAYLLSSRRPRQQPSCRVITRSFGVFPLIEVFFVIHHQAWFTLRTRKVSLINISYKQRRSFAL